MADRPKILVVEDDQDLVSLMRMKFTQEGFDVTTAETGGEALEILKKEVPELVVLDILLPDIDGLTVLHQIAEDERTRSMPVIIFSNLADQGSFDQVKAVGKYEYLVKATADLNDVAKKIRAKIKKE
jgi:CheY-like chemotaxis protein